MKIRHMIVGLIGLFIFGGCNAVVVAANKPMIDVEIINRSTNDIENAKAGFGEYDCAWGLVTVNASATYAFYPHPVTVDVELRWDGEGKHRMEKIDLRKIYTRGKSGRLTFIIYSGRVEVIFAEKTKK